MERIRLELEDIEVSFLDKKIFKISKLRVYEFDRIGIVGANGAGKSTLLKLLACELQPNKGYVGRFADFGYFEQIAKPFDKECDFALRGKLGVPQTTRTMRLSGGEQTRLKLAQLLSIYHKGLLIDEPTTHLDAEGIQFFINELQGYYGALVLISHDRYVLDELVNKIWEVKDGKVTEYKGNYTDYMVQKELEIVQQRESHEQYLLEKTRLINAANEKKVKAKQLMQNNNRMTKKDMRAKAGRETKSKETSQKGIHRAAKAIEQRIAQLKSVELPIEVEPIHFYQPESLKIHNRFPVMADNLTLYAGDKQVLHEVSFQLPLGQKIAIKGANGSGKTTLLKHIVIKGQGITLTKKAVIGYFEQLSYHFKEEETVIGFINARSDHGDQMIRNVLHVMNFKGNDLKKSVTNLSGGEAIRLQLCHLFLGRYNILILDEPTNFLDVTSMEALERLLVEYDGTVIFVDRKSVV